MPLWATERLVYDLQCCLPQQKANPPHSAYSTTFESAPSHENSKIPPSACLVQNGEGDHTCTNQVREWRGQGNNKGNPLSAYRCPGTSQQQINQQKVKHPIRPALKSPLSTPQLNCPHTLPLNSKHPCRGMIPRHAQVCPIFAWPNQWGFRFEPFLGSSSRNHASNISSLPLYLAHWL